MTDRTTREPRTQRTIKRGERVNGRAAASTEDAAVADADADEDGAVLVEMEVTVVDMVAEEGSAEETDATMLIAESDVAEEIDTREEGVASTMEGDGEVVC